MRGPRHESARLQSDFFRVQFHKMMRWLLVSLFILFILLSATIYLIFFQPKVSYYANTIDGKILNMPSHLG